MLLLTNGNLHIRLWFGQQPNCRRDRRQLLPQVDVNRGSWIFQTRHHFTPKDISNCELLFVALKGSPDSRQHLMYRRQKKIFIDVPEPNKRSLRALGEGRAKGGGANSSLNGRVVASEALRWLNVTVRLPSLLLGCAGWRGPNRPEPHSTSRGCF